MSRSSLCSLALVSCAAILAAAPAQADTSWTGLADTDWQNAGNWDNGVPDAVTDTYVDTNSGNMPVISGGTASTKSLNVGSTAGSDASLTLTNAAALTTADYVNIGFDSGAIGVVSLYDAASWDLSQKLLSIGFNGNGTVNVYGGSQLTNAQAVAVGEAAGSGTLLVSGAGANVTITQALYVGAADGVGTVTVADGGRLENSLTTDWYAMLATAANSTANVTVTGDGSLWIVHSNIYVGYLGNATLDILDGGVVESLIGQVGIGGVGNATVSGAGSTWEITEGLYVGDGSDATLTITAGGVVTAASASIAGLNDTVATITVSGPDSALTLTDSLDIGYGGLGTLLIEDGGTVSAAVVNIGADTGGFGNLTVTGGNSTLTATTYFNLGYFSAGEATVADGGAITVQNGANIGYGFEGNLTVTGTNSTFLVTNEDLFVGYSANATVFVGSGGTINIAAGKLVLSDDDIFANVTLGTGGTLQVGGENGLSAWNANSNYEFLLAGGTLKVVGADLTTDIFLLLGDDTNSIIDTNGFNATLNGEIGGPGGLIKNGAGVLSLVADNCYNGTTVVNAGTLNLPDFNSKIFGDVLVNAAGTLSGNGDVFGNVTLNGTLSPGNTVVIEGTPSSTPGIFTTSNMTWNAGSTFQFKIDDAIEDCGCAPSWDLALIYGDLDLPADLLLDPMTIYIVTLDPDDGTNDAMANFDFHQSYSWAFALASDNISGFDPDKFELNLSLFANVFDGTFSVSMEDNQLLINYAPVPEPSTYAALVGAAALAFAALRRRRRQLNDGRSCTRAARAW